MKITFTIAILSSFLLLNAQITITSSFFPESGDTLFMSFDDAPTGIVVGSAGVNQTWDFSSLNEAFDRFTVISDAASGSAAAEFPQAELYAAYENGGESYFNVTSTIYEQIGYKGLDPADLGIEVVTHFDPSIIERRAPMNFLDINSFEGNLNLPIAADQLPQEVLDMFPIAPDSVRIRVNSTRDDVVDAWGSLTIPAGTYEVLRERRIENRDTRFDILVFGNWLDVTDLVPFTEFLGLDTITTYNYFTNNIKEPIAIVTVATDGTVTQVEYKDDQLVGTTDISSQPLHITAFPNPASDHVNFKLTDIPQGQYAIVIYNILGHKVWEKQYQLSDNSLISENLSLLSHGVYLYSLQNEENGKVISTRRLVKL